MDEGNLDRFIGCASAIGLTPLALVPITALKDPTQRRLWTEQKNMIAFGLQNNAARVPIMVDILIAPCIDVQAAFARAVIREMGGISLSLAAVEDMIQLKEGTGRAQGESDIEHLERVQGQHHGR
jgi:hypothetical protein